MIDQLAHEVGPHRVSGASVFLRGIAGGLGGIAGTMILFLFILLSQQILDTTGFDMSALSPVLIFVGAVILFLGSLISNALGNFLIALTDPAKYEHIGKGILQVLLMNIIIFIFVLPAFLVVKVTNQDYIFYIAVLQFLFSALTSALVFNAAAIDRTQSLLNIYSVTLGVFIGILFISLLIVLTNPMVAFFLLPAVVWFTIGFFGAIIEYYYYQLYKRSGVDFLQTDVGFVDQEDQSAQVDEGDIDEFSEHTDDDGQNTSGSNEQYNYQSQIDNQQTQSDQNIANPLNSQNEMPPSQEKGNIIMTDD